MCSLPRTVSCPPSGLGYLVGAENVLPFDLNECAEKRLPFPDSGFEEMLASHLIEHIPNALSMMGELWRVAKPSCKMVIRCPYGSSDDAWEDPTHVRPYFINSFGYFSQPYYWRATYGYSGDWQVRKVILGIRQENLKALGDKEAVFQAIMRERNIVHEMIVELEAIKPARAAKKELQETSVLQIMKV
jgi:hypothetical protein